MINTNIANSYLPILLLMGIAFSLGAIIVALPYFTAKKQAYSAKNSQYECGFRSFDSRRKNFDVRFYLISILFVVFDIEIALLFPWASNAKGLGIQGLASVMVFLMVLAVGFIYEWKKGALDL